MKAGTSKLLSIEDLFESLDVGRYYSHCKPCLSNPLWFYTNRCALPIINDGNSLPQF